VEEEDRVLGRMVIGGSRPVAVMGMTTSDRLEHEREE
jgi:hypothetical protein